MKQIKQNIKQLILMMFIILLLLGGSSLVCWAVAMDLKACGLFAGGGVVAWLGYQLLNQSSIKM